MSQRYCPVCWATLGLPTGGGLIPEHFDSVGRDVCPMAGEDFTLAGYGRRRLSVAREYIHPHTDVGTAEDTVGVVRIDRLERLLAA
ncbi:hypothetical protein NIIDNTM18_42770 [Mycolicibacterium litorale]|uniref:Uncharacterized protein n=1 Tax=Mycolicibacterium litorale TaxID=758802 RepID=A0A6S6P9A5_9MYCO|nr:hypothetical protein [Mycolicibacterium litorale]BCI54999.1 hypothetical protein NIIDNTM18_42770 [Mycolicibacterium litorale]